MLLKKKTYETKINFHTRMMEREKYGEGKKQLVIWSITHYLPKRQSYGMGIILELTDDVSVDRSIRTNSEVCKAVQIQPNVPKLNKWHFTVQSVTENNSECRETHTQPLEEAAAKPWQSISRRKNNTCYANFRLHSILQAVVDCKRI